MTRCSAPVNETHPRRRSTWGGYVLAGLLVAAIGIPAVVILAEGDTALGAFSHGRVGLNAGTLIYYRGYAINELGTGYSPEGTFYTEPGTQVSDVGFVNVTANGMRITWTAGSGDGQHGGGTHRGNDGWSAGDHSRGGESTVGPAGWHPGQHRRGG